MPEAVISDIQTAGDSYNLYEESVESSIFDELLRNTTKLNNNPYKKLKTHKKGKTLHKKKKNLRCALAGDCESSQL